MKAKYLLVLWIFLSISATSFAQFHCGTVQNSSSTNSSSPTYIKRGYEVESNHSCSKSTDPPPPIDPQDPQGRLLHNSWINNSFMIPEKWVYSTSQNFTIKVVIHVLSDIGINQNNPATNENFLASDPNHVQFLTDLVNIDINNLFQFNRQSVRFFGNHAPDTKIRFQLEAINYHQICQGGALHCSDCMGTSQLIVPNKLNLFLCGKRFHNNGFELFGSAINNVININNLFEKYRNDSEPNKGPTKMLASRLFGHEFGHCLGLGHSYDNPNDPADGTGQFLSMDFLRDVFGPIDPNTNQPILPFPHVYSWDCTVYNTSTSTGDPACSDNMMAGHKDSDNFSFIQIGRMLRLLSTNFYYITQSYITNNQPIVVFSQNQNINNNNHEEWFGNGDNNIYRDIIVPSGVTLVMRGRFNFDQHKKIIVQKNAKLIIKNAILTSIHPTFQWGGIQLEGDTENSNYFTSPQNMANLEIEDSEIQYSDNAITNWNPGDWNSIGGLVKAKGVVFYNNRRSVEFMKMKNINFSKFENCIFKVANYPFSNNPFFAHVTIWANKNIKFDNCRFINCDVTDDLNLNKDKGIFSYDASYSVNNCEFRNHSVGIHAVEPNGAPYVRNAKFLNNGIGVKLIEAGGTLVMESEFTLGKKAIGLGTFLQNTGIFNRLTSSYLFYDNTFIGADPNSGNFGVFIRDGGPNTNKVYRNNFDKVGTSVFYFNYNRDPNYVWNGASFACNTFDSYLKDVRVEALANRATDGIRTYQASNSNFESAGNKFTPGGLQFNIENQTINPINYYYGSSTNEQPLLYSPNVVVPVQAPAAASCSSKLIFVSPSYPNQYQGRLALKGQLDSLNQERKNLELTHRLLIDGGNTQQIQNEIGEAIPEDAWNLRSYLLSFAPNLSNETLIEAAYSGVLPTSFLMEVCLANPDATRSEDFLEILQNQIPIPISVNLANLIRASWDDPTTRTLLELALAHVRDIEQEKFTHYLTILQDDSVNRFNEIRDLLIQKGDPSDYFTLAMHYASVNWYDSSISVLQNLPAAWLENSDFVKERNGYLSYFNLMKAIYLNGEKLPELSSERLNELRAFSASNELEAQQHVKNILCFFYQECEGAEPQGRAMNAVKTKKTPSTPAIQLFPNPCTDYISISLGKNGSTNTEYQVFDMNGKNVYTGKIGPSGFVNLETKTWSNGTYSVRINATAGPTTLKFVKR